MSFFFFKSEITTGIVSLFRLDIFGKVSKHQYGMILLVSLMGRKFYVESLKKELSSTSRPTL